MAQEVMIAGALFSDVPSIRVPDSNNVYHPFVDTSDANATAADIASGKTAYVDGAKVTGTASGGSSNIQPLTVLSNGTYTASGGVDGYSPVTVSVSGGGGGTSGDVADPIRFFDYDGTLVASYNSVPAALPSVPAHDGLINGTWNYTLAQITTQFNAVGTCDVGANYDTVSGATEIDIVLQDGRLHPYLSLAVNGTVSIDWGDGSTPGTATGTSLETRKDNIHHVYESAGSYTIKITKTSGTGYSLFCTTKYTLLNKNAYTAVANRVYSSCVHSVRVGANCTIGSSAFYSCFSLASVSIPSGVTSIGDGAFHYCYSLASVSIPSGVTSIGSSAFYYCYSLASVSIPSGVTSIGDSAFYSCYSLASLTIPSDITSIGNSVFHSCYGMAEYHLKPTTPPTLVNTNAFYNIQSDCKIYVPANSLENYKTASNWSTYAGKMVGE